MSTYTDYVNANCDPDEDDGVEGFDCERCGKPLPVEPTGEYMERGAVKEWARIEGLGDVPAEFEWEPRPEWACPACGHVNT